MRINNSNEKKKYSRTYWFMTIYIMRLTFIQSIYSCIHVKILLSSHTLALLPVCPFSPLKSADLLLHHSPARLFPISSAVYVSVCFHLLSAKLFLCHVSWLSSALFSACLFWSWSWSWFGPCLHFFFFVLPFSSAQSSYFVCLFRFFCPCDSFVFVFSPKERLLNVPLESCSWVPFLWTVTL